MARDPTRFSRVSVGYVDSEQTLAELDENDTGPVWSSVGPVAIGEGADLTLISSTTHEIDFGSIGANETSITTVGVSNATNGDTYIVNLDSEFSGAPGNYEILYTAHSGATTGEVNVLGSNQSAQAINPIAGVVRLTRIAWSDYL